MVRPAGLGARGLAHGVGWLWTQTATDSKLLEIRSAWALRGTAGSKPIVPEAFKTVAGMQAWKKAGALD
ncbi:hypothetical protein NDU88_006890 [Pleurodeles waltl]|uniref:Uncharacterized protein n=1 Tax=Pleurodeles waltl TaxID=8319 RepID=A0AAV7PM79_PLEWA|nr:hypothetical protein NDU88_006890 [Pleurodeles waltl]